ncbi:hypothetical protein BGX33_002978, partial [Mortierella sp. NVP41]
MKSLPGLGTKGHGMGFRPRTQIILGIIILALGWILLSTVSLQSHLHPSIFPQDTK